MAAHIYTALQQISKNPSAEIGYLEMALGHTQWGDQLQYDDWLRLNELAKAGDAEALSIQVDALLPIYKEEWERLGQPTTSTEWNQRKYGGS